MIFFSECTRVPSFHISYYFCNSCNSWEMFDSPAGNQGRPLPIEWVYWTKNSKSNCSTFLRLWKRDTFLGNIYGYWKLCINFLFPFNFTRDYKIVSKQQYSLIIGITWLHVLHNRQTDRSRPRKHIFLHVLFTRYCQLHSATFSMSRLFCTRYSFPGYSNMQFYNWICMNYVSCCLIIDCLAQRIREIMHLVASISPQIVQSNPSSQLKGMSNLRTPLWDRLSNLSAYSPWDHWSFSHWRSAYVH